MNDYAKMKVTLQGFLDEYKKEALDEIAPDETTNAGQKGLGKEMTADAKKDLPEGTAAGESTNTAGVSDGGPKVVNEPIVHESNDPGDDMNILEDKAIKKAAAAQIRFEVGLMNMIDREFEAQAYKTASAPVGLTIKEAAEAWKGEHIRQIVEAFGVDVKTANEILNQLAEEDPAAVLPPEAFSEEDADDILAAAADADAEEALANEGDEGADEELLGALTGALEEMQASGASSEEALGTLLEQLEIGPEEFMEVVVDDLREQGLSDEEITELAEVVDELQAEGVTPEDLAEILNSAGSEE